MEAEVEEEVWAAECRRQQGIVLTIHMQ